MTNVLPEGTRSSRDPLPPWAWSASNLMRWRPEWFDFEDGPCPWSWLVGPVRETPQ